MQNYTRNPYFDLSRAVCLVALCYFHFYTYSHPGQHSLFVSFCSYALPFFFVLSGYLIHGLLIKNKLIDVFKFYRNRFLRIAPAYFLILCLASVAGFFKHTSWSAAYALNFKVFLLSLSSVDLLAYMSNWYENGVHYWSMGVEEQFYLLYPLFLIAVKSRYRKRALVITLVLFWFIQLGCTLYHPTSFYGVLLPMPGQYILWGALLREIQSRQSGLLFKNQFLASAIGLFFLIFFFGVHTQHALLQFQPSLWAFLIAIPMSFLVHSLDNMPNHHWVKGSFFRFWRYIGRLSYGVYLLHLPVLPISVRWMVLHGVNGQPLQFAIFLSVSVFLGVLLWEGLERPINLWRKP